MIIFNGRPKYFEKPCRYNDSDRARSIIQYTLEVIPVSHILKGAGYEK